MVKLLLLACLSGAMASVIHGSQIASENNDDVKEKLFYYMPISHPTQTETYFEVGDNEHNPDKRIDDDNDIDNDNDGNDKVNQGQLPMVGETETDEDTNSIEAVEHFEEGDIEDNPDKRIDDDNDIDNDNDGNDKQIQGQLGMVGETETDEDTNSSEAYFEEGDNEQDSRFAVIDYDNDIDNDNDGNDKVNQGQLPMVGKTETDEDTNSSEVYFEEGDNDHNRVIRIDDDNDIDNDNDGNDKVNQGQLRWNPETGALSQQQAASLDEVDLRQKQGVVAKPDSRLKVYQRQGAVSRNIASRQAQLFKDGQRFQDQGVIEFK